MDGTMGSTTANIMENIMGSMGRINPFIQKFRR